MASATIANPGELAHKIIERDVVVVDRNGAPAAPRRLVFYNPPVVNAELGIRRSSLLETQRIASSFLKAGAQTIVFGRSRLQALGPDASTWSCRDSSHRAGWVSPSLTFLRRRTTWRILPRSSAGRGRRMRC